MTDSPKPLPYDMGNIGDLLKHGVMAEFIRWRSDTYNRKEFVFLDPFCGDALNDSANTQAMNRLQQLRDNQKTKFEILNAQPDFVKNTYYGSTHVVLRQTRLCGLLPHVYISDEDSKRVETLIQSDSNQNTKEIKFDNFYPSNGYSILDSINERPYAVDMVLIDPFLDMEKIRQHTCSISRASQRTTVVLFVLMNDHTQWKKIQAELPEYSIILTCPRLKNIGIKGESNYTVKVILTSHLFCNANSDKLYKKLKDYTAALTDIVGKPLDGQKITCK